MKTYCAAPFVDIYADNSSRYRLCCRAGDNPSISKYHTNETLPFDFFFSDEMEQIRQDMFEGKQIKGCEVCYKIEEAGRESWRLTRYSEVKHDVDKVRLKLRIGGSSCNLGCYMCQPYNSSTRRNELKETGADSYFIEYMNNDEPVSIKRNFFDVSIDNIIDNIEFVEQIHLTGGEPLMLPRTWELVERIPDDLASNIKISMDTNLTILEWKGKTIDYIIDKFRKLDLSVSCDHFGDKLAWIRYPIDVKSFEDNLIRMKEHIHCINVTVSILNAYDLKQIEEYYAQFGLKTQYHNVVVEPSFLSIKNLKDKEELKERYSETPSILHELEKDSDETEYEKGLEYCRTLEKNRNIKLIDVFEL